MAIDILMPALSPTMEEGTLAKWLVKVGDEVKSGVVIAEIETDKATMEVEAVDEGVVAEILVGAGTENVKVNAVIARIAGEGEASTSAHSRESGNPEEPAFAALVEVDSRFRGSDRDEPPQAPKPLSPAVRRIVSETGVDPKTVEGTGKDGRLTKGDVLAAANGQAAPAKPAMNSADARLKASPLARRIASEKGVDLKVIKGSGPDGRIILRDVQDLTPAAAAAPKPAPARTPPSGAPDVAPPPAVLDDRVYPPDSYVLKPLDGMRKTVARRLSGSFMYVPHFPLNIDLEIDKLLAARAGINAAAPDGVKISVNDMLIKASAKALMAVPEANASFTEAGIAYHKSANVSVAVAIDGGLITPVIRDAQTKGLAQIAAEMKDLAGRARDRKLTPQEYVGGTFSISNLGMFGIKSFGSIINPPEGMILSVGAGEKRAVVKNDQIVAATVMSVTLSCDHRVVDGAVGARWLEAFKRYVETPEAMLL